MSRKYITTAIDFPNAAPHMGHVYEKILADVVARWWRLCGHEVRFHLGTDENGIKMQQTAQSLGISPRELVDRNAPVFEALFRRLDVSFDTFIRTADPVTHWPTVEALWRRLRDAGHLEKRTYEGLYCTGCERFVTAKDLVDGLCPDHKVPPQTVAEENWFFLLARQQAAAAALLDAVTGSYVIVPAWRGNEVRKFLEGGLEDVSFSRSTKTLHWGVPVPDDAAQVMYVWCDNLASYISSLGYLTDHPMTDWWDGAEVTHVIGKDIARFHAINWPIMLQCAGLKTPDRLLIHGFITSDGQKMSKSLGNVVDPVDVLARYPVDALRYFLTAEVPVGNDGDFTWKRFGEIYDSKLRNQLGNLLNRVLVLLHKDGGALSLPATSPDVAEVADVWTAYRAAMDGFEVSVAIAAAMGLVDRMNARMNELQPWKMEGQQKRETLSCFAEQLRHVAVMLLPVLPQSAAAMLLQLNVPDAAVLGARNAVLGPAQCTWGGAGEWSAVGQPSILFAPVDA